MGKVLYGNSVHVLNLHNDNDQCFIILWNEGFLLGSENAAVFKPSVSSGNSP